jgi:hypothetical protein
MPLLWQYGLSGVAGFPARQIEAADFILLPLLQIFPNQTTSIWCTLAINVLAKASALYVSTARLSQPRRHSAPLHLQRIKILNRNSAYRLPRFKVSADIIQPQRRTQQTKTFLVIRLLFI